MTRLHLWATAIREGLVALLPLTLLSAAANVLTHLPLPLREASVPAWFDPQWMDGLTWLFNATTGIMGLTSAIVIAMRLSVRLAAHTPHPEVPQAGIAAVAACAFLLVVLPVGTAEVHLKHVLGYASILQGLLVGIATAELMSWADRWLPRRSGLAGLEGGIPFQQTLRLCQQALVTLLALGGLYALAAWLLPLADQQLARPLMNLLQQADAGATLLNILLVLANQVLWLLGVNGGQFLPHAGAGHALLSNTAALYAPGQASTTFTATFAHLGGSGATWGLVLACLWHCRDAGMRKLAWLSLVPAIFNVNELLLFGIPLVFGRALLWPFLLAPAACALVATAVLHAAGLPQGMPAGWSTPIGLSGWAATGSWAGVLAQLLGLACATAIYTPFVRRLEAQRRHHNQQTLAAGLRELLNPPSALHGVLQRTDALGDIARRLRVDFERDLGTERVTLAYQPQHDVQGAMVGVEALLRWTHAVHGPIPTAALINMAEECPLIHDIGNWVTRQACADLAAWRRAGLNGFGVSVNMSPLQLEHRQWLGTVRSAVAEHGVDPCSLDLEITEGRMMSASRTADDTLAGLQALGCRLSMDDFGMGCTSLLYMQRFAMHSIKLDGSLTRDVLHNPVAQDIIRAVCQLGASRGAKVVAEFVEHAPQRDLLQSLGCDSFQGWLYSAALPADQLGDYARRHLPATPR